MTGGVNIYLYECQSIDPCVPYKEKLLYSAFLWIGFNCLNATEPLRGDSLNFTYVCLSVCVISNQNIY